MLLERPTMPEVAKFMNMTLSRLYKAVSAWKKGGLPYLKTLKWQAGPKVTRPDWTREQIAWATSRTVLRAQAGMSMAVKAKKFERKWRVSCRPWELRKVYRGSGISIRAFLPSICGRKH